MKRRDFIAALGGAMMTWPLAARAQQDSAPRRLGVLMPSAPDDLEVKKDLAAFTRQMQSLGWTEGGNLRVDYRWSGGDGQKNAGLRQGTGRRPARYHLRAEHACHRRAFEE